MLRRVAEILIAGLALAFVLVWLFPPQPRAVVPPTAESSGPPSLAPAQGFRGAVARASPWVVNIYANKRITERRLAMIQEPILRRFIGVQPIERQRIERALGSGVAVDRRGYVLTNAHVIAGADQIQIALSDGRVGEAVIVGIDPETDLAVLKTTVVPDSVADLNVLPDVAVGDLVLAIGNPFGIGQTVTMGIVSATGRSVAELSLLEDFIQTDAPINSGNSGGALVNTDGELVGIATAMLSRATGAQGIGFAIPARVAAGVLEQIVRDGSVNRGWLGLDAAGEASPQGDGNEPLPLVVTNIDSRGPAAQAGLRPGDLLYAVDGQPMLDGDTLARYAAARAPGTAIRLRGERTGVPFEVTLRLGRRPPSLRP